MYIIQDTDQKKASRAFTQAFNLLHMPLIFFTSRLTGDLYEAEEIVSDSFQKAWGKKADFTTVAKMKSFLYTVCRNAAFDLLKDKKRLGKTVEITHDLPDEVTVDHEMMRAEIIGSIYREIDRLPILLRSISKLAMIEGKTVKQVASILGKSEQTIRNSLVIARKKIRLQLSSKGLLLATAVFNKLVEGE